MNKGDRKDQRLLAALTGLMVLIGAYIGVSLHREEQRRQMQAAALMVRAQQVMKVRADAFFTSAEERLMQEAFTISAQPRIDTTRLMDRWRSLMASNWPIVGVALADGQGNTFGLTRSGDALLVSTRRVQGGRIVSTEQRVPETPGARTQTSRVVIPPLPDPRTEGWMSKALENNRDVPIWASAPVLRDGLQAMWASYRIRTPASGGPDQVLMFLVAPQRSEWLADNTMHQHAMVHFLITDDGRLLNRIPADHWSAKAIPAALAQWERGRGQIPSHIALPEGDHLLQVTPYDLNGRSLRLCTLVPADQAPLGQRPERRTLYALLVMDAMGLILCICLWIRRGQAMDRIRRQERRNRKQELRLVKALGEREVLNREVHHRVKNNLQIVSSLLNLQVSRLGDGPSRDEFLRGKLRIDTMALVHHKLYGLKDLREVDLDLFFRGLMGALTDLYAPQSRTVSHEVHTNGIKADQDAAIALGMILCELAGNAFRHAFPYATGGHIDVMVQVVEGDLHRLLVKDNGNGIASMGSRKPVQLGLEIVEALAEQLDGTFHISTGPGTTAEVLFRMRPVAPSGTPEVKAHA
jgi:two-component sensor histidine kinase